jgi:protein-disulfide isomerase
LPDLAEPVHDGDHVRGAADAELVLVMYGDFECPYCAAAQGILHRVEERLGDRLRFVFRHFPLDWIHPHALHAAQAAEAAGAQGAFWEMHDALFNARGRLEDADLVAHAERLGLDAAAVDAALRSGTHTERIERDRETGTASGVTGTPGFFANGTRVEGAFDAGSLVTALTT